MTFRRPRDLLAGLIFVAMGALFLATAQGYALGTPRRMGPGWFPSAMSICLMACGAVVVARSFVGAPGERLSFAWRPMAIIGLAIACFALLLERAGVVVAVFVLVLAAASAHPPVNLMRMAALATGLSLFCALVFIRFLGLPMTWFGRITGW